MRLPTTATANARYELTAAESEPFLTTFEAAYRGDGLRAWKGSATRTYVLYDGINVVCEEDAVGDLAATRLVDGKGNELASGDFDPRGYRARYGYYTDEETSLVALA